MKNHHFVSRQGKRLRIFVGEAQEWHGKPLYQAIVEAAQQPRCLRKPTHYHRHYRQRRAHRFSASPAGQHGPAGDDYLHAC